MNNNKLPKFEIFFLLFGEIIVGIIISLIYLLIRKFDYTVPLGALLGGAVTVLNFLFLSISTGRIFDKIYAERGNREMSEEEAEAFAKQHEGELSAAVKRSFIIRTLTMLLSLVGAFLLEWFNVIATLVPLLMLRPLLTAGAIIKDRIERKRNAKGGGD